MSFAWEQFVRHNRRQVYAAAEKAAQEASATIKRILELGFTMNQIFIMRHDLISAVLGNAGRVPLAY